MINLNFGNMRIIGLMLHDDDTEYRCYLPSEDAEPYHYTSVLNMNIKDWEKFVYQTDNNETKVLATSKTGRLVRVILRKTERQIAEGVRWKVFVRDNYTCQYCYINSVPLTVDHLVTWEMGGPTTEENLLTSCRKCNQIRGNMPFADWLESESYLNRSKNVPDDVKLKLLGLVKTLDGIPRKYHLVSKR